jgi:hypothetical protein
MGLADELLGDLGAWEGDLGDLEALLAGVPCVLASSLRDGDPTQPC